MYVYTISIKAAAILSLIFLIFEIIILFTGITIYNDRANIISTFIKLYYEKKHFNFPFFFTPLLLVKAKKKKTR